MSRLPPRSTRTDTLFPYTTLFRSFLQFLVLPPGAGELRDRRLVARLAARQLHEGGELAALGIGSPAHQRPDLALLQAHKHAHDLELGLLLNGLLQLLDEGACRPRHGPSRRRPRAVRPRPPASRGAAA